MKHHVNLHWADSPDGDAPTSFNVKRAATTGGPYTTIGTTLEPTEAYEDDNVEGGKTYFYVTTALNAAGESAPSNEVKAIVPFLAPGAPVELGADVV